MTHYTHPYDDDDFTEPCFYCGTRSALEPYFGEDREIDNAIRTLHTMWVGSTRAYERAIALTLARIITMVSTAHLSRRRLNPIWWRRNRGSARG
ncbi:hypothetical protein [Gordonia otitidis]|uniref:Uncharacterized protein n=1 Tax=Gordonia otitidis (strain DSM 44809 / CCUG 52243 / JCM 12355 / NBRC 100426 / IFM 10032) TaxID=1108044 RepID=H5TI63_GORO1|nr:hypothetical protein [Gordonia otitidis]GAB33171.1 hypothetical protein GOOTI_047_00060 [Gordonia otitidis NBRC 100426]